MTHPEDFGRELDRAWVHCIVVKSKVGQGLATQAELEKAVDDLRSILKKIGARLFDPADLFLS